MATRASKRSVENPPVSLQVGYWAIGWDDTQLLAKQYDINRKQLGEAIAMAFDRNDLGILCLCQVGTNRLDEDLDRNLGNSAGFERRYSGEDVNEWLKTAIQERCKTSVDLQVYVLGPYAIVLDTNVCCFQRNPTLTDALVTGHNYRRAVNSVIQVLPNGPLIDVWVHCAESGRGRGFTAQARDETMTYFFDKVSDKGIVGGNLNMSKVGVSDAMRAWSRCNVQERWNRWEIHMLTGAKHGDLAMSTGLRATQILDTGCHPAGNEDQEEHDLVVLQISLQNLPRHKRPALESSSDVPDSSAASSAAQPAPGSAAQPLLVDSRARQFLTALDKAADESDDNPARAKLLRSLVTSLWHGQLLGVQSGEEEKEEDCAIAKLDELIELVVTIRMAWIQSPESDQARKVKGRILEELNGDLDEEELKDCHNHYMNSLEWMIKEKRDEYERLRNEQDQRKGKGNSKGKLDKKGKDKKGKGKDKKGKAPGQQAQQLKKQGFNVFCFQKSGSKQLLFALVRQPSLLQAKGVTNLLDEWKDIKESREYKHAVEQSKKRTAEQTLDKAELQNLRIKINRLSRNKQNTDALRVELQEKEKSYGRGKQKHPPGSFLATNQIHSGYP